MIIDDIKNLGVRVVAVSKYVEPSEVVPLFNEGFKEFGENRVQVLKQKIENLKDFDIKWHFIGNLQKNKVNELIRLKPAMWQSCNSYELATYVDKRLDYKLDTLFEINSAFESTKYGADPNFAIDEFFKIKESCKNLNLIGVMSIGSNSDDEKEIIKSFELTYKIFEATKSQICSMGMSDDYKLAIKCGSNMIRLGRILFK